MLGVAVQAWNPSIPGVTVGEATVQGQRWLPSELEASLGDNV